tara:strand:- start:10898 stop:11068 length:171 start_codon:yes stop_codon:yes gene_type:complete
MGAGALVAVKLGVFSGKKIRQQKIREEQSVILQWWNMMHLLGSKYFKQEINKGERK